jgi:hypothetical protein
MDGRLLKAFAPIAAPKCSKLAKAKADSGSFLKKKLPGGSFFFVAHAEGGGRTHTDFIPADFKSAASAYSATPAFIKRGSAI